MKVKEVDTVDGFYCADCGVERINERKLDKFLPLDEDTYTFSFITMLKGSNTDLRRMSSLYLKAQTIFFIQLMIILFLIYKNVVGEEAQNFILPDAMTMFMRLLTAYLFHIETLGDA
jgi:hypothetical protein